MRTGEYTVRGNIVTELYQHGAVERVQLEQIRPTFDGAGQGLARCFKLIQLVVGERQIVLHLWRVGSQSCGAAKTSESRFELAVLGIDGAESRQFLRATGIVKLFANRLRLVLGPGIQFLGAFLLQSAVVFSTPPEPLRQRELHLCL